MTRARPLRFLALVLCAWVGTRAVVLNLPISEAGHRPASALLPPRPSRAASAKPWATPIGGLAVAPVATSSLIRHASYKGAWAPPLSEEAAPPVAAAMANWGRRPAVRAPSEATGRPPVASAPRGLPIAATEPPRGPRRWSGSAWLLLRDDRGAAALAPVGTLGGSQAGARLSYRVGRGLALSGRAYLPLRRAGEAEVAAGLDWQPSARLPLHLLAERRQDVGGSGRSAFALTLYGGAAGRLPGGVRAEAYAQAGLVGLRSRDLFVDGAARVALPVGPLELGGGAWGAAQPGAARLDAGPTATYRLPVPGATLRLEAGWRFRIAGDAAPGSGPALTLAADF